MECGFHSLSNECDSCGFGWFDLSFGKGRKNGWKGKKPKFLWLNELDQCPGHRTFERCTWTFERASLDSSAPKGSGIKRSNVPHERLNVWLLAPKPKTRSVERPNVGFVHWVRTFKRSVHLGILWFSSTDLALIRLGVNVIVYGTSYGFNNLKLSTCTWHKNRLWAYGILWT